MQPLRLTKTLSTILIAARCFSATGTRLIAGLIAASVAVLCSPAFSEEQHFITIGTGGVTGVYYPAGGATCKIVNLERADHGVRCSVESTLGSIVNITQIRSADLEFGFAQSDWQHHAFLGTSVFEDAGPFEELRSVFSLHAEVATIVVRADSGFQTFEDLKGARINTGSKGSGAAASWNALVDKLGWADEDRLNFSNRGTSELAEALCNDDIEAYFLLIGHPAALIEETQEQCDIRLIGVESADVAVFVEDAPYYMATTIPAGLYEMSDPLSSFGVVATVVTSAQMPDEIVATLVEAVHENFDNFKTLHPALTRLSPEDLVAFEASAPLHPGALKFFQSQGLLPADGPDQRN